MTFYYVAVSGVQQIVVVVEAVLRDGVVNKIVVQVQIHHQLRCKQVVNQRYVVSLLYIQIWITIEQCYWVRLVNVWVQVRDTRTTYAHVVGKPQITTRAEVVLHAGCWNQTSVACAEVIAVAQMVFHILPGVLVAQTSLKSELVPVARVFAITCQNRVLVFVLRACGWVVNTLQVVLRIRCCIVQLQLASQAKCLSLCQRHCVVNLEYVVGGLVFVVRESVCKVDIC